MSLGCAYKREVPSAKKPKTTLYTSNKEIFLKSGGSPQKYMKIHNHQMMVLFY